MKTNLVAIISGKAKASTKFIFGLFLALPLLMQIDGFKDFITPLLALHPKAASAFGSITAIALLLHNPQVQQVLGIGKLAQPVPVAIVDSPTVKD